MLESATELMIPTGLRWELLVVDNGDGRETATVVDAFQDRLPIRRTAETIPGLSQARNRGVSEARGRYICWVDDDVLLDPQLLNAYVSAFQRFPDAVVFGGRILPKPQQPSPAWFRRCADHWLLLSTMAHRDMGDAVTPITHEGGATPYGANFAVRADAQRRWLYNTELGVGPGRMRSGEESDLIYRLLKEGGAGWWTPGAKVRHVIPLERQTWPSFLSYYRQIGETAAYLRDAHPGDNAGEVKRRPIFSFMSDRAIRACAWINGVGLQLTRRLGMYRLALGFGARQGFYEGVGRYRGLSRRAAGIEAEQLVEQREFSS